VGPSTRTREEKNRRYIKERRDGHGFVALPHIVIRSDQFVRLSAQAVKLLIDLTAQYDGRNNGDLCATWSMMEVRGWKSRDTLAKAIKELVNQGFIVQTRQGGRHAPSLYGITFYALDESSKLDIRSREFPRGAWARTQAGQPPSPLKSCDAERVNSTRIDTPTVLAMPIAIAN